MDLTQSSACSIPTWMLKKNHVLTHTHENRICFIVVYDPWFSSLLHVLSMYQGRAKASLPSPQSALSPWRPVINQALIFLTLMRLGSVLVRVHQSKRSILNACPKLLLGWIKPFSLELVSLLVLVPLQSHLPVLSVALGEGHKQVPVVWGGSLRKVKSQSRNEHCHLPSVSDGVFACIKAQCQCLRLT